MSESRLPMVWGDKQDAELQEYYRWLVHFRRDHSALWNGRRQTIHLDDAAQTYAYTRSNGRETITIALNLSDQPRTVQTAGHTFDLPAYGGDVHVG
jgi:glycosidase